MIPTAPPPIGTSELPARAQFWTPRGDEVDEESGIGFFQDTWLIRNVPVRDAWDVVEEERQLVDAIDELASTAEDFERLAGIAEYGALDDPAYELSDAERTVLSEWVSEFPANLGGLELGVAGLVRALATVRIIPGASCRSHPERSWSDAPVVLFAANEFRARALEPLVADSGCTFGIDEVRPELLVVRGTTVRNLMALAEGILENRQAFVQKRGRREPKTHVEPTSEQETLFD